MILTFDKTGWFFEKVRDFLASIDGLVFSLLSWIIEGIFNLSHLMFNMDFVRNLYSRIYIVLSIFMIFKLSFSFFKYLVSPDAMNDKEQGVGKLISRVVVMIILLIAFPIVFFEPLSGDAQNRTIIGVLQDGVVKTLPRIILGQSVSNNSNTASTVKDDGRELALAMLKSFYYPAICNSEGDSYDQNQEDNCNKYFQGQSATVEGKNLILIDSFKNFTDTASSKGDGGYYAYQYMWPLTTIAGILMIFIMVGFSIDVAIRSFKLLILEVMAPVPIMTYIDPKASKDDSFSAWSKSLISTYIDLFVKLGSVYLILLLSSELFKGTLFEDTGLSGMSALYLKVFLVIGLFQFAKEAPKFIKEALGIKDSGGSSFMGKAMSGLAGAAAGFAGGIAGGGGLAGGLSAAAGGFSAGAANSGSGKPLGMYSKSRDEMAKTTGGIPGGLAGRIRQSGFNRNANKAGYQDILADEQTLKDKIISDSQNKNDSDRRLAELRSKQSAQAANVDAKRTALTLANQNATQARANMASGMYKQVQDDLAYARNNGMSEAEAVATMPDDVLASYNAYKYDMSLIDAADSAQNDYDVANDALTAINEEVANEQNNNIQISQGLEQSQQDLQDVQKKKDKVEKGYSVYTSKKDNKTPTKKNPYEKKH